MTLPPCDELLDALAVVLLARVDAALRVDGDAADGEELPGIAAAASRRWSTGASVSRCSTCTFLLWPSATNSSRCCASDENATSHAEPYDDTTPNCPETVAPSVFFETTPSFTNLPSFWNTWMRLLLRSQT